MHSTQVMLHRSVAFVLVLLMALPVALAQPLCACDDTAHESEEQDNCCTCHAADEHADHAGARLTQPDCCDTGDAVAGSAMQARLESQLKQRTMQGAVESRRYFPPDDPIPLSSPASDDPPPSPNGRQIRLLVCSLLH